MRHLVEGWLRANALPEFVELMDLVKSGVDAEKLQAADARCAPLIGRQAALLVDSLKYSKEEGR